MIFFGEKISKSSVNNLAKSFHDIRQSWAKSTLEKIYKVIYCNAIYITPNSIVTDNYTYKNHYFYQRTLDF